jgi:hypothetical protein
MIASDYPVTLRYGATVPPYTADHPHRGRDYGCPSGTPVLVGGEQIGLSGATGKVIGPHLHVQEWSTDYAITRDPQNAFNGGTVVNVDRTGTQGDGSFGKFVTVQTPDGWHDSYCHLSEINVEIGDKLGDTMTEQEAYAVVSQIYRVATDVDPEPGQADYWAKRIQASPATAAELASALGGSDYKGDLQFRYKGRHYNEDMETKYQQGLADGGGGVTPYSGPDLFVKNKEK